MLFKNYSYYLKETYGETVYRIGIDGGFSCPNRGVNRQAPGCAYCDVYGVRSAYLGEEFTALEDQINKSIAVVKKRYGALKYILYFQAYSSTWAPVSQLKKIYDKALSLGNFVELIVSTRPDCITEEIIDLLVSYKKQNLEVWVELGLQSADDKTLKRINRGHDRACFEKAYKLLKKAGIKVVVHLIFGLPEEDRAQIMNSVDYVAQLRPDGVKFHNLHIPSGSPLYAEYAAGELSFPDSLRHIQYVVDAIERMPPETIIMRLTTDTSSKRHNLPGAFLNKSRIYELLEVEFKKRGTSQAYLFNKESENGC